MSKFKVGDKVRRIGQPNYGGKKMFKVGDIKTIFDITADGWYIFEDFDGPNNPEYFEIVKEIKSKPIKYNLGKPLMNLVRPEYVKGIAEALTYGANKYEEKRGDTPNYLKGEGFHYTTLLDSLERHLNAFKSGVDIDEESGIHHLLLAATNIMFLHTYEISDKGVDDREILNEV